MYTLIVFCLGGVAAILADHFTEAWRIRRSSARALDRLARDYKARKVQGR